jgi:hypothetical protein
MNYMFLPFHKHIDYGFGSMASSFFKAAEGLMRKRKKHNNENIISCFLFRHSIELALKAIVLIVHRGNGIQFQSNKNTRKIIIELNGESRNLFNTHDIDYLFKYYVKLISENWENIKGKCNTNWPEIPAELQTKFDRICRIDPQGYFFRYPNIESPDPKSYSRKINIEKLINPEKSKPKRSYLVFDKDDYLTQAYEFGIDNFKDIVKDYYYVANQFEGAVFGMRVEMAKTF